MKGTNKGCETGTATKMTRAMIHSDGNCLFNCASLAMEGTVDKPDEIRQNIA